MWTPCRDAVARQYSVLSPGLLISLFFFVSFVMAGFDKMESKFNALLHPPIDSTDTYDPTFMGVTRKRRCPSPTIRRAAKAQIGKSIATDMTKHNAEAFVQLDSVYVPLQATGATRETRFFKGFVRRSAATIGTDRLRENENARLAAYKEDCAARRRARLTAAAEATGARVLGIADSHTTASAPAGHRRKRAEGNYVSHIFSHAEEGPSRSQAARALRLEREGLGDIEREWSVKQSLHSWDGFVLPNIRRTPPPGQPGGKPLSKSHQPTSIV